MSNGRIKGEIIGTREYLEMLKKQRRKGETLKAFAKRMGDVTYQFMSLVLSGEYNPGPTIAKAMGYRQVVGYEKMPAKKPKVKAKAAKAT